MTTHPSGYTIGDRVYFGRGQGQQTLGEVVKTHGGRNGTGKPLKKLKVKQLESRGTQRNYPVGTVWGVPASLLTRADGSSSVPAPAPCAYKVGDRVVVKGWADKEVEATVTKPGTGNRCEVYDGGWFPRTCEVVRKVSERSSGSPTEDIARVESTLDNPEVLWADGERSRTEVKRLVAALNRAKRALRAEAA